MESGLWDQQGNKKTMRMFLLPPTERGRDRERWEEGEWLRLEQRDGDGKKRMNLDDILE